VNGLETAFQIKCWEHPNGVRGSACPIPPSGSWPDEVRAGTTEYTVGGLDPDTEYELELRAWYGSNQDSSNWVSVTGKTLKALSINAWFCQGPGICLTPSSQASVNQASSSQEQVSCQVGESVDVTWDVTGGRSPFSITVDGTEVTSKPASVVCKERPEQVPDSALSWLQDIIVQASDSSTPPLQKSDKLQVTVFPPPLELKASLNAYSCAPNGTVELAWSVSGGRPTYTVKVDGVVVTESPVNVQCQSTEGTQTVEVTVEDSANPANEESWTGTLNVTIPPPPPPPTQPQPLSLTNVKAMPDSCDEGGTVSLSWTVSGGTPPYTVEVDDVETTSNPFTLTCQDEAGSQTAIVTVTDDAAPSASVSASVTVTVLVPEITVTGRVNARRNDTAVGDVEVEFGFRPKDAERILPEPKDARTLQPQQIIDNDKLDDWYLSSSVIMTIDEKEVDIGQVRARLRQANDCRYYFEVCFRWSDGEAQCPGARNFYYAEKENLQWSQSHEFSRTFRPGTAASSSEGDTLMDGTGVLLFETRWSGASSSDDSAMEDVEDEDN